MTGERGAESSSTSWRSACVRPCGLSLGMAADVVAANRAPIQTWVSHPHMKRCNLHAIRIFHALTMFVVTEAQAAIIRATYERRGGFFAAVELRHLFPGIADIVQARLCVRTIG